MTEKPDWWTSDEWSTPPEFVQKLIDVEGPFTLDVCCRPEVAKADLFFTKEQDGLAQPWFGRVWCNPPYSNPKVWCQKAAAETQREGVTATLLLPAATDTRWFHEWVLPYAEVEFLKGRIKFIGWQGTPIGSPKSGSVLARYPGKGIRFA